MSRPRRFRRLPCGDEFVAWPESPCERPRGHRGCHFRWEREGDWVWRLAWMSAKQRRTRRPRPWTKRYIDRW